MGAIGFEMLGGRYAELYSNKTILYALLYTCEEFLEMFGVALFIYALLSYIVDEFKLLTVILKKEE